MGTYDEFFDIPRVNSRERSGFEDRPCGAGAIALGDARGAVLGLVGVGVGHSIFDVTGHIPVGVVGVSVRCSSLRCHGCDCVRDDGTVLICAREPARRGARRHGLRVVHAGVG